MTRRLVLAFTLVAAVVALALAVPLALIVSHDQRASLVSDLEVRTLAAASVLASQPSEEWASTVSRIASETGARVVVVDPQARLVADSDASGLDRLFTRPEIDEALAGRLASDVRPSTTLGTDLRYVAAPVVQQEAIAAAVRLSLPEDAVTSTVQRTQAWLAVFVLAVVAVAALIGWLMARSLAAPLGRLAEVAERLPDDLSLRARDDDGPREVRSVARALNATAARSRLSSRAASAWPPRRHTTCAPRSPACACDWRPSRTSPRIPAWRRRRPPPRSRWTGSPDASIRFWPSPALMPAACPRKRSTWRPSPVTAWSPPSRRRRPRGSVWR